MNLECKQLVQYIDPNMVCLVIYISVISYTCILTVINLKQELAFICLTKPNHEPCGIVVAAESAHLKILSWLAYLGKSPILRWPNTS